MKRFLLTSYFTLVSLACSAQYPVVTASTFKVDTNGDNSKAAIDETIARRLTDSQTAWYVFGVAGSGAVGQWIALADGNVPDTLTVSTMSNMTGSGSGYVKVSNVGATSRGTIPIPDGDVADTLSVSTLSNLTGSGSAVVVVNGSGVTARETDVSGYIPEGYVEDNLPANVAYTDAANIFSDTQNFALGFSSEYDYEGSGAPTGVNLTNAHSLMGVDANATRYTAETWRSRVNGDVDIHSLNHRVLSSTGTTASYNIDWANAAGTPVLGITGENYASFSTTTGVVTYTDVSLTSNVTGTLASGNGGTGFSTYTKGDIVWASATNTLAKLGAGTTGQFLKSIAGSNLQWGDNPVGAATAGYFASGDGSGGLAYSGSIRTDGSNVSIGDTAVSSSYILKVALADATGGDGARSISLVAQKASDFADATGTGGEWEGRAGAAGDVSGEGSTAGAGGPFYTTAGAGGAGTNSDFSGNSGGEGGSWSGTSGAGGASTNSNGGDAGPLSLTGAEGGAGGGVGGAGGPLVFAAGSGGVGGDQDGGPGEVTIDGGNGLGGPGKVKIGSVNGSTTEVQSLTAVGTLGYRAGAGGTVTQATSKATTVVLNKVCGTITMNNALLVTLTTVSFTFTNSTIAATDVLMIQHDSAGTLGSYTVSANTMGSGSCQITVRNAGTANLSEAIVLRFVVFKAVTS